MHVSSPRLGASRAAALLVALASGVALTVAPHPSASASLPVSRIAVSAHHRPKPVIKVKVDPRLFGVHDANLHSLSRPGTGSIRLWDTGTTWAAMQPTQLTTSFTRLDQIVADAHANGTEVTLVTAMTPAWAGAAGVTPRPTDAPDVHAYQAFVRSVMLRYKNYLGTGKPGIANYQVWNEANITTFWTGTVQQMAGLTKAMYDVRNAVDPSVRVIAPAMVTRLGYQQRWLKRFYAQKVAGRPVWKYVDAISLNLYPLDTYPSGRTTRPGTPEDSVTLLHQVRTLLTADKVPASIPIWNTEVNYGMRSGQFGGTPAVAIPAAMQISYVMRTFLLNAAQGVRRVDWYAYDMGNVSPAGPLGNTLLTDPTNRAAGILTPAGLAFTRIQSWMHGILIGTTSARPCARDSRGTYTCVIKYASGMGRVYWNPFHTVRVRLVSSARKKVDEYGIISSVKGGSRLRVGYAPVLVKSRR